MKNETWIKNILQELSAQHHMRHLTSYKKNGAIIDTGQQRLINFSSNNYLDLIDNEVVIKTAEDFLRTTGTGAGASRLVTGTFSCHEELEKRIARFKEYPTALIFGSGFLTNLGVISVCVGKGDYVFADRLSHASIIDAIRFCGAHINRFNHNDPDHLQTLLDRCPSSGKKLIVTESVFSMDGDCAPLSDITALAVQYSAMVMIDEAHATGVFGPGGRGLVCQYKLESLVNVSMGTFSKALASYGGFVTCSDEMRALLINKARSFIYTTALPPAVIGAINGAFTVLESDSSMGTRLLENASFFRSLLNDAGLNTGKSSSQIVPVIIGDSEKTLALSQRLKEQGLLAVAIRPPTVPRGTARLRLSITLGHSREMLQHAAALIIRSAEEEGVL